MCRICDVVEALTIIEHATYSLDLVHDLCAYAIKEVPVESVGSRCHEIGCYNRAKYCNIVL